MVRASLFAAALVSMLATLSGAQTGDFKPVTREMLANPPPGDWLMLNRTYDEQRFSPLKEINRDTVAGLALAWARGLAAGTNESIPIVYQGVMYVVSPGAGVLALDATNGDLIWDYSREYPKEMTDFIGAPTSARQKGLAIFEDMIFFESPDGFLVALDARTGKVRWETKVQDYKDLTQAKPSGPPPGPRAARARRSLFEFDLGARYRDRAAQMVLPASAGGRLGPRPHPRANAAAHRGQSRSRRGEVDQPQYCTRARARRRGRGRRGRWDLGARPRQ